GLAANQKPSRHFAKTGTQLSDLQPENITGHIAEITKVDAGALELTNDDFGLLVSSDFSWVRSETIRFVFSNQRNVPQTAQLRLFPEDPDFFVTEPADWVPSEGEHFKLQLYLEALKYLPQEAIAALCEKEPQRYAIALADGGGASDPARCIYYDKNGVTEAGGWWVQLDVSPLYWDEGGGFYGVGSDVIHLYYGDVADTVAPNAMRPMVMVNGVLYLDTGKEVPTKVKDSAILGEITSSASASEKPTKNGQCNFGSGVGAKYAAYEDGMAVFLDYKWFFFEKETDDTVSTEHTIMRHDQNGEVLAEGTAENQALAQKVVMDGLVKSAAWEGVDVGTLEKYYLIRQSFPETGEVQDYYAYRLADGTAAIQFGTAGRYSILSDALFEGLEKDVSFPGAAPDVQPESTHYLQSLTDEERKQTEEVVRAYFTDEAPYYEGVVSMEPMPNESVLYQNTGIEAEYAPGNIIIYKVLTGRDQRDNTPERSASVARASKDAPWTLINQGY
ncbi:MAG: hypothetical protein RR606_02270, partial [Oscillospiraceae bacterium]